MLGPEARARRRTVSDAAEVPDIEAGVEGDGSEAELPEVAHPAEPGPDLGVVDGAVVRGRRATSTSCAVTAEWGRYATSRRPRTTRARSAASGSASRSSYRAGGPARRRAVLPDPADRHRPGRAGRAARRRGPAPRRPPGRAARAGQRPGRSRSATPTPPGSSSRALTVTALDGDAAVFLPIDDPLDGGARRRRRPRGDAPAAALPRPAPVRHRPQRRRARARARRRAARAQAGDHLAAHVRRAGDGRPVGEGTGWPASSCPWTSSPTADVDRAARRARAARRRLRGLARRARTATIPDAAGAAAGRPRRPPSITPARPRPGSGPASRC